MIKKEYNLQIQQHNIHYINIIQMKDIIISWKVSKKEKSSKDIMVIIMLAEIALALILRDLI